MMRVIRTELYFGDEAIRSEITRPRFRRSISQGKNDGLAFLWFRSDSTGPYDIHNHKWFSGRELKPNFVRTTINLLLQDPDGRQIPDFLPDSEVSKNDEIINFVFDQYIVIEQSPPKGVKFGDLLKRSNTALLLGAYVGQSLAGDNPALLILTIPGGIIAVGSALGIADAMADGLHKHIGQLFGRK